MNQQEKKSGRTTHGSKYLKTILVQCAWAATRTKGTYFRSKYESLVIRRGKKRALIAIGRKILIASYFIIKDKEVYDEKGEAFLKEKQKAKQINNCVKKLLLLGCKVNIDKEIV